MDADGYQAWNQGIIDEFRANGGKVGGRFADADLLLLTTAGAKSGRRRVSPLSCKRIDGRLLIVAGYGGADVNPAWVHNLRADARASVELGGESFDVTAHELTPEEREAVIPELTAAVSAFAEYQAKTSRVIPIFELRRA